MEVTRIPPPQRAGWGRATARALRAVLLLTLFAGCQRQLTADECNQLIDRYVELLLRARRPDASAQDLAELQAAARARAAQASSLLRCNRHISRRAFRCAMQEASTADELERCLL